MKKYLIIIGIGVGILGLVGVSGWKQKADLRAKLESTVDDGGESDFVQLEKEASGLE